MKYHIKYTLLLSLISTLAAPLALAVNEKNTGQKATSAALDAETAARVDADTSLKAELEAIELKPGPQGPAGPGGAQGATGAKGGAGAVGATGAQGVQGLTGNAGATGGQGVQGLTGNAGATGGQGAPGSDGTNGSDGSDGTDHYDEIAALTLALSALESRFNSFEGATISSTYTTVDTPGKETQIPGVVAYFEQNATDGKWVGIIAVNSAQNRIAEFCLDDTDGGVSYAMRGEGIDGDGLEFYYVHGISRNDREEWSEFHDIRIIRNRYSDYQSFQFYSPNYGTLSEWRDSTREIDLRYDDPWADSVIRSTPTSYQDGMEYFATVAPLPTATITFTIADDRRSACGS
jgi:hypothetical protein